jgi:hypothetical protein
MKFCKHVFNLLFGKNWSYDNFNEFCPYFLGKGKKNTANFEHYDLRDENELDPNIWWVVGIQVNYKILLLKFSEKLLFSNNPPISAHALLSGSFRSLT